MAWRKTRLGQLEQPLRASTRAQPQQQCVLRASTRARRVKLTRATTSGSGRACGVAADGGDACVRAACARLPCVCAAAVGRWALGPAVGQGFCILDMRCYAQFLQCTVEIFRILSAAGSHSATAVKVAGHSAMAISAGHGGSWTEHSLKTSGRENSS